MALPTNFSIPTNSASNEVVLVHLHVDQLTAKKFHPCLTP